MSWTFVACIGIAFAWLGLFYLWGRGFLTFIKAERDVASSICFGYLVLQVLYQIIYLPFYFSRGSYRATVYIWIGIVVAVSIVLVFSMWKNGVRKKAGLKQAELKKSEIIGICAITILVLGLACYISLHVPYYGQDTVTYITYMNHFYYDDSMFVSLGNLSFHYGMSSMLGLFTMPSLLAGIKPYYTALFTIRIVGVCLFSLSLYRMGEIIWGKPNKTLCWSGLCLAILVPYSLMFWGSNYTAEFFYWRINEAKGYCQFVLMPISFSVFLEMFKAGVDRKKLWKEQLLVGLAAVPISASALTGYLFLLLMASLALLAYDKMKKGWKTLRHALICALPNLVYLAIYILEKKSIIAL